MTLSEGNLEMDIPGVLCGGRFDGAGHRLSHCMKAVDFVLELADRFLFIEVKDPQHPRGREIATRSRKGCTAEHSTKTSSTSIGIRFSMNGQRDALTSLSTTSC